MAAYQSELAVITKAKDLCSYVMTVTDKSPKRFRFTLVAKLQNYALDIIENLYRANEVFVKAGDREKAQQRIDFQHQALTELKLLGYMAQLSMEQGCILPKQYLLRRFPDKEVLAFLYQIIDSYNADTGKGLPMGNQSSQWFALYYLNQIDRIIKEKYKIKHYTRYMDDLILLHEDKEHLKTCLAEIRAFAAEKLKLEFNEKTQIFPVSEGVDYLGWRFYLTDTGKVIRRLRTSNKRRFKRRLKAFREKYRNGEMDLDAIKRSLASYDGHLQHGHTWKLKTKVYGNFVLTKAPKRGQTDIPGKSRDRIN